MKHKQPLLFEPYTIKDVTFKNRIVMAPMCMYSSHNQDGKVENWHLTHYTSRAVGQVGLIVVEATSVTPQGRISAQDLGIWEDSQIEGLHTLTSMMKEYGTVPGIQLAHAGRKAGIDGEIIAPASTPFKEGDKEPKAMTKEEIVETIEAFRQGAIRAKKAGFEVIEIHAAHGYLINEFLSPAVNTRTDEYGGSKENQYRFLHEIISAIKTVWDGPLFVRISASDYSENGYTAEDYVQYAQWMKEDGIDLVDISSGGVLPVSVPSYPGYQVPFSETIKHGADMATGAVGLITTGIQAEEILQNNRADLIFLGRELLRDPYWPKNAAKELRYEITPPVQYRFGW